MRNTSIIGMLVIGALLLFYVFAIGRIANSHSVQLYLLLCTGILSVILALHAAALTSKDE